MHGSRHAAQSSGHTIRRIACHEIRLQLLEDIRAASQLRSCFAEVFEGVWCQHRAQHSLQEAHLPSSTSVASQETC